MIRLEKGVPITWPHEPPQTALHHKCASPGDGAFELMHSSLFRASFMTSYSACPRHWTPSSLLKMEDPAHRHFDICGVYSIMDQRFTLLVKCTKTLGGKSQSHHR
ncbi:hypothetical protein HBI56_225180 [Parastagonospora nodorum]|uniref:Uncharacterized protein n=1 Tax=Phaeosphaeria nodorum (strain SN15 / ATCC MYA-4574 / FGSC 10173) TaxID=321614 RepID=A0A7U2NR89_PHANO|nr:hypothetical protein HBH56_238800 [Parastagonospora nodorum]QRD07635.1 hypothetical protein JI435_163140 [Parastagonospora nodorum SN15]KAH3921650.1 hypothetical protein HBH54_237230 [Parastagonospora nodorum]KAH3939748.1 hypothetical protein HBH53_229150 [Parastagonospora nodorum]KAH3957893.1 hypothetical protein HBH51_217700 [Parastagonospora nodorum]